MYKCKLIVIGLLLCFSNVLHASTADPVTDQPTHSVMSAAQLTKVITKAGLVRGWTVKPISKDKLMADIHVRSHYVAVNITLHPTSYDITYHDSKSMKYKPETGKIHRKYNGWVANLNKDIQRELLSK